MAGVVVSLAVCLLGLLVVYRCLAAWGLRAPGGLARHAVEEGPPAAQGLQPGWKIFLLGAGSRVGLLLAGMVAAMLLSDGGLTWEGAFQQLQRWDAAHYIHLIEEGYQGYTEDGQHLFLVFFPGYVWAARLLRLVIPSTALAGMALSCLCYGGACCYLYRLAGEAYNGRVARDALLYMSLFPFSFFSGLVMTEGLFLLATTGACWYAWRGKWLAFGLFGALAALTRMTGLLVSAVGVIRLLEAYRPLEPPVRKSLGRCWKPLLLRLPLTLLPAAGTLLYLLLNLWGGRRPLRLCLPPGALAPGLPVDFPGGGVHRALLGGQPGQLLWLGGVGPRLGPVCGGLGLALLGRPAEGPPRRFAGLWLLLLCGNLFPLLAAQRREVPLHLLCAVSIPGKADPAPPGFAGRAPGRGRGAFRCVPVRLPRWGPGDVKKGRPLWGGPFVP